MIFVVGDNRRNWLFFMTCNARQSRDKSPGRDINDYTLDSVWQGTEANAIFLQT